MKQQAFTAKRWRRVEYQRLVDVGAFEAEPLELIGGQLMVAEPKGSEHSAAVDMAYVALLSAIRPAGPCAVRIPWLSTMTRRPSRTSPWYTVPRLISVILTRPARHS
jgi:hypothetical protein